MTADVDTQTPPDVSGDFVTTDENEEELLHDMSQDLQARFILIPNCSRIFLNLNTLCLFIKAILAILFAIFKITIYSTSTFAMSQLHVTFEHILSASE